MYIVGICVEMYAQTRLYKPGKWHNIRTQINLIYIYLEKFMHRYMCIYIYTLHKLVVYIYIYLFIHIFSYGYECTYLFIYIYM